jgi:hypothetical protein
MYIMYRKQISNNQSSPSFKKRVMFFISLAYNYILQRPHHSLVLKDENEIVNGKPKTLGDLYLGALPMARVGLNKVKHHDEIINKTKQSGKPLGLVVGAIEDFELKSKGLSFFKPIPPKKWLKEKYKVTFTQVSIPDFTTYVNFKDIDKAVKDIDETRKNGKSVYVHCKAGRVRSVLLLMCYLTTAYQRPGSNDPLSYDEAYRLIKNARSHIDFNSKNKKKTVMDYINHYKKIKEDVSPKLENPHFIDHRKR